MASSTAYDNPEKSSLQINTKKKSNYGSLRKDPALAQQQQIVQLKHKLVNGETLQGISLKYSVPIENIKRANKLWTNDLAMIKDFLIIPIEREKYNNEFNNLANGDACIAQTTETATTSDAENKNYKDYLTKFDTFLNESKLKLKNLESIPSMSKTTSYSSDLKDTDDDFLFKNPKLSRQDSERKYSYLYTNEDILTTPDFIIKQSNGTTTTTTQNNNNNNNVNINTNGNNHRAKHAYETLQKLEKEKDDLFEL